MNEDRVKAALADDHFSKAAYTGKVTQTERVTVFTEDGTPIEKDVTIYISWDSVSAILKLVQERAGI